MKGAFIPIGGLTSGFSSQLVKPGTEPVDELGRPPDPRPVSGRCIAVGRLLTKRSCPADRQHAVMASFGDEPWAPVWPDNVGKTGDSPNEQSRSPIAAAQVEQVERTRRKTWSRARSEFLCPTASFRTGPSCEWLTIGWRRGGVEGLFSPTPSYFDGLSGDNSNPGYASRRKRHWARRS